MLGCIAVILALGCGEWEDQEFKVTLGYVVWLSSLRGGVENGRIPGAVLSPKDGAASCVSVGMRR